MSPEGWGRTTFGMILFMLTAVLSVLKVNNIINNTIVIVLYVLVSLVIAVVAAAVVSARIRDYQDGLPKG